MNKKGSKNLFSSVSGLIYQVVLVVLAAMFANFAMAENFTVSENFILFKNDLANVYAKYGSPDFSALDWCLIKGNTKDLVYVYCDGLDFSIVFDSDSFFAGESSSDESDYKLLRKITEEEVLPSQIQEVKSVGESITVISRNTTQVNLAQTVFTIYWAGS